MNNTRTPFSPEERLYAVYGSTPPVQAMGRLKTEQILLRNSSFYDDLLLIGHLRECARDEGAEIRAGGNLGASFIAWLYGCTDANPLPPHTLCRKCKRTIFSYEGDGWDLPALECCGEPLYWTGSEIPVESLTPRIQSPDFQLDLYLPQSFEEHASEIIREHYRQRKFTLIPYTGVNRNRNEHDYVLIPANNPLPELDSDGIWHTDLDELFAAKHRRIHLICDERKEQIRTLRKRTGLDPSVYDLLDESVLSAAEARIKAEIQEEGGTPLESDKLCFSSLLNEYGYLRSAHTGDNPVYHREGAHYSDVFTCREQVWNLIQSRMNPEYRLSSEFPLFITKRVRRGMFTGNRMDPETEKVLRGLEIPEPWIEQMKQTEYLPAKADLIASLLDELKLVWYEQHDTSIHQHLGRFMLYHGKVRPSDSYLASHTLPGYAADDWYHEAYDINDDEEALQMKRVCKQCGKEFTLSDAAGEYDSAMGWPYYTEEFIGDLCAECAIRVTKDKLQTSREDPT